MTVPGDDDTNDVGPSGLRDRLDRMNQWRVDLTEEARVLPQTMADLRKVIADLKRVSERLERATEGIEMLLDRAESSGLAPMARQLNAAAGEMESQLRELRSQVPGGNLMDQAVDELQRTFEAFTGLIPKPKPPKR